MPDHPPLESAAAVRARLAAAALGLAPSPADAHVGPLTLHPYQRHAVARLRYTLTHARVALLADDVGLGKTAVALALARDTSDAVVVVPAALRHHWCMALRAAHLATPVLTMEALGRDPPRASLPPAPSLVVVDEAHHFRNPHTRRWQQLAALASRARLLLLTATPVHNRPEDLATLFALALGARAHSLDAATFARLVVRRSADHIAHAPTAPVTPDARPSVAATVWSELPEDPELLAALRALPPAPAPADGTPSPALERYTLLRLWTSSDAALRAGLRRRIARALALGDVLDAGAPTSRAALHHATRALAHDPTTHQLALLLPDLGTDADTAATPGPPGERERIAPYVAALRALLAQRMARGGECDAHRVRELRAIRARYPGARIVAFSHSADTVRALYRALAPDGRVAMLTASGGRIASGVLARAEVLARFAPLGQGASPPPAIERIDVLLTTDVLAEGLDLRDASVVVHLDRPWTPARLAQRTGRVVRPGSRAATVHVHAFRPPPRAARELRLAAHARAKRAAAAITVGSTALEHALDDPDVSDAGSATRASPAVAHLARDRRLEQWSSAAASAATHVLAVRAATPGYLAVLALPSCLGALRLPVLVAALDVRGPTASRHIVRRALAHLQRAVEVVAPSPGDVRAARRQLTRWARRHAARGTLVAAPSILRATDAVFVDRLRSPVHAALLARSARALHAAAPHERSSIAAAAALLRAILAHPISADQERALRDAAPSEADDRLWLRAAASVAACASSSADRHVEPSSAERSTRATLRALVILTVDRRGASKPSDARRRLSS